MQQLVDDAEDASRSICEGRGAAAALMQRQAEFQMKTLCSRSGEAGGFAIVDAKSP
jgi:hypothetical protein